MNNLKSIKNAVFAIDFDGTITKEIAYPKVGDPNIPIINFIKHIQKENIIILNTCRVNKYLDEAVAFCSKHGIRLDCINENHKTKIQTYGGDPRKISADYYIDDKNVMINTILDHYEKEA